MSEYFRNLYEVTEKSEQIAYKEVKKLKEEKQELLEAAKKALNAINKLNAKAEPTGYRPISNKVAYKLIEAIQKAEGEGDNND